MMDYTKGPWTADGNGVYKDEPRNPIATAYDPDHTNLLTDVSRANAQLMASSPDMYEALKAINAKYDRCVICKNLKDNGHDYNCPIMQALSKAEGRQSE